MQNFIFIGWVISEPLGSENRHFPLTWGIALTIVYALTCYTMIKSKSCTDIALFWVSRPFAVVLCFYGLCKTNTWILFPVWNPIHIGDIKRIEATQIYQKLSGYRELRYKAITWWRITRITTLKLDSILMYKILYGLVAVGALLPNVRLDDRTRGDFKILKPHCNVNCRAHFLPADG